jgi:hypothetical protein
MWGSGFIPILIYSNSIATAAIEQYAIITENGMDNILTENSQNILTEAE